MEQTISAIGEIIQTAERMKSAFYWRPPTKASERRSYEKRNSVDKIEWEESGHSYTAEYIVSCSCHNVYAYGVYTKDGRKTTLTAIKNSYKRLTEGRTEK